MNGRSPSPATNPRRKLWAALAITATLAATAIFLYSLLSPIFNPQPSPQDVQNASEQKARTAVLNAIPSKHAVTDAPSEPPNIHNPICLSSANADDPAPVLISADPNALPPDELRCPLATGNAKADAAKHVTALCRDHLNRIWVGTEGEGIWCYDPSAPDGNDWTGYGTAQGLGDNYAYAIAEDKLGRIWIGHLNHGVSVFNGQSWKNYDILDGPIGERLFAITTSPLDGDVWMATSAGLTRYSLAHDSWSYYTRDEGLPSDQANSLAFDTDGTLYVATQCDGIAIGSPRDAYRSWGSANGPGDPPIAGRGTGLPTDFVNQVMVARNHAVYAATTAGLAISHDRGASWAFFRGQDWREKAQGFLNGLPQTLVTSTPEELTHLPIEDYLTYVAEEDDGRIYVGTRQHGYETFEPAKATWKNQLAASTAFIRTMLVTNVGLFVGQYSGGLTYRPTQPIAIRSEIHMLVLPFPTSLQRPTVDTIAHQKTARNAGVKIPENDMILLSPDWRTQGSWLRRYGHYWMVDAACDSPNDICDGSNVSDIRYKASICEIPGMTDTLRYWVATAYDTDIRSMQMPEHYFAEKLKQGLNPAKRQRRLSEWDDHGEAYPMNLDGLGIDVRLGIPRGRFMLSVYTVNFDGDKGRNRYRDYALVIKSADDLIPLAHTRVCNFYGGVYSRFLIAGPKNVIIHLDRSFSLNTILNGVFVDKYPFDVNPAISNPSVNKASVASSL